MGGGPTNAPGSGEAPPAAFYRYPRDRKGEHAKALLGNCSGFLDADGYGRFESVSSLSVSDPKTGVARLTEVACWSHARRKLYDVYEATQSPLAREWLERIAPLFEIEARIKDQVPDQCEPEAVPLLTELKSFWTRP